jgi:hypothetical protein
MAVPRVHCSCTCKEVDIGVAVNILNGGASPFPDYQGIIRQLGRRRRYSPVFFHEAKALADISFSGKHFVFISLQLFSGAAISARQ